MNQYPNVIILAGPNGAGKSTSAPALLNGALAVDEFVNADAIAAGLSLFHPEGVAVEAGRVMLKRLRELADKRANFAFESTLAARSFAPWLKKLHTLGYKSHLQFLALPCPEAAIHRVAARVSLGGHAIAETDIRRRFAAGLHNFFDFYTPIVSSWKLLDNSDPNRPHQKIAEGGLGLPLNIIRAEQYNTLLKEYGHAR